MSEGRRYEVQQTVGVGGMGSVYRARLHGEGDFAKEVALKVLHRDLPEGADIARRLRDEARILGLLRHRALVHVDGLVSLAGCWTVVMEYVEGLDLKQILERVGPMPESCGLEVISEVAGALHVAQHTTGPDGRELRLLHRDIKPANVQVTVAGEVKVLDFGVARADFSAREAETQSLAFGSLGYVAQERIDGIDVPAGDIYSLGVVLYEILTGDRFGQTFLHAKRHEARLADKDDALARKGVGEATRALIRDMLAFDPAGRPSAREVERRAGQIRASLGGEPLRDWAEEKLPAAVAAARDAVEPGGLVGRTLEEDRIRPEAPAPPAPPPRKPGLGAFVVGLGLLSVLLVAGALLLFVGLGGIVAGSLLF